MALPVTNSQFIDAVLGPIKSIQGLMSSGNLIDLASDGQSFTATFYDPSDTGLTTPLASVQFGIIATQVNH